MVVRTEQVADLQAAAIELLGDDGVRVEEQVFGLRGDLLVVPLLVVGVSPLLIEEFLDDLRAIEKICSREEPLPELGSLARIRTLDPKGRKATEAQAALEALLANPESPRLTLGVPESCQDTFGAAQAFKISRGIRTAEVPDLDLPTLLSFVQDEPEGKRLGALKKVQRLWAGAVGSQFGSAIGLVALPVIAVIGLQASEWQVSMLAGLAALTTALMAFPVGHKAEYMRKRPVMIACDVARAASLMSIPIASLVGVLTFTHLCVVSVVNAVCAIAFTGASQ